MKVIKHTTGKDAGRISVLRTISTMEPGDIWTVREGEVVLPYVHTACSRLSRISAHRAFSVKSPAEYGGKIEIICKEK
jgi:hypothetical protein